MTATSSLNNVHYRTSKLCRVSVTLGKGQVPLGKVFAECNTRQKTLGKGSHGNVDFAECRITGTRQTLFCRVPWHSAKQLRGATLVRHFAECLTVDTRHSLNFCRGSASDTRQSSRDRLPPHVHFAECWTLALGKVPATGWGHLSILLSAGL